MKYGLLAVCAILLMLPAAMGQSVCGNNSCERGLAEDFGTCPQDCETPEEIEVTILAPANASEFARGEEVIIQARVRADSIQNAQPHQIRAVGKFGSIDLFDDGKHHDMAAGDRIYGNSFIVDETYTQQSYHLAVTATIAQTTNSATTLYTVTPFLAVNFSTNKETYALGEEIVLVGRVTRKQTGISTDVNIDIVFDDQTLYSGTLVSDSNGAFQFSYQTTTIHPAGDWTLKLRTRDDAQNYGFYEKTIDTFHANAFEALQINYLTRSDEEIQTGEQLIIEVEVLDAHQRIVENATVVLISPHPNEPDIPLWATGNQRYQTVYKIPYDLNVGQQRFELRAQKDFNGVIQTTSLPFIVFVRKTPLQIVVIEPKANQFSVGERIPIEFKTTYSDNQPVSNALITLRINDKDLVARPTDAGLWSAQYQFQEEDLGKTELFINVYDTQGNSGETRLPFLISGFTPTYYIEQNAPLLMLLLAVVLAASVYLIRRHKRANRIHEKQNKQSRLRAQLTQLQEQYYKEHLISRETYDSEREKLQEQLDKVETKLAKLDSKPPFKDSK